MTRQDRTPPYLAQLFLCQFIFLCKLRHFLCKLGVLFNGLAHQFAFDEAGLWTSFEETFRVLRMGRQQREAMVRLAGVVDAIGEDDRRTHTHARARAEGI
jgi:hypothetical protein